MGGKICWLFRTGAIARHFFTHFWAKISNLIVLLLIIKLALTATPKKLPQRQCLGCREMKNKRDLIRVVKSPEGEISLDFHGKKPGRGAYVCRDAQCLKKAIKARALERALSVQIPAEIYERLEREMEADNGG